MKSRFYPPSPLKLYQQSLFAQQATENLHELADGLAELESVGESENEGYIPGSGIGLGIDLDKAKEFLEAGDVAGVRKGGKKDKLRQRIRKVEEEFGAGTVVVLGDLAVCFVLDTIHTQLNHWD